MDLNLQMFAEEMAAQESTAAAGTEEAAAATEQEGTAEAPENGTTAEPTFEELIKGKFKQEYQASVQRAISQRFRNQKDLQKQYTPIMQTLGQKYGIDPGDIDGIAKRLSDDDSLYAEEANKLGLPVKTVKQMKQMEAELQQRRQLEEENQQEMALRAQFDKVMRQAEDLKKTFPSFDLGTEMEQNPRFARMIGPEIGMSVEDAYYACHGKEIQQASMQQAAQQAGQRLAASVQAGAKRPLENGVRSSAPVNMGIDVAHMSREQRADIRRRVKNGERGIDFRTKF